MSSTSSVKVDDKFLLDRAAEVACLALGSTEKTQINSLLTFMQNFKNAEKLELLIMRQIGRGLIGEQAGRKIIQTIEDIKAGKGNQGDIIDTILDFLGYVKWAYESVENERQCSNIKDFNSLVKHVAGSGSGTGQPPRPQGYGSGPRPR
ncbi:hypothetical protein MsedC_1176 [Metallosphaera sedula]|nr:hypothetical protein [Metallosphaera prunae]AKV74190.1 hypothetical protein MsedA_1176 [Metallosphaera sedula]AKV76429.1 hypothetical protein MsedB_1178 [Metallosphaera sedula]AKV78681.1 hypothetical protein MsedC_1176 [Metallosphaera sedula]AKV80926.1 hypothetical protein MsedD_1177 [Metallosphaera sedula]AKV83168.1 hypothetical protein MsedE_1179 [Metallosphaera sedula]